MGKVEVAWKPDTSIVTEVDRTIQDRIFQAIHASYPDHAVLGEETVPCSVTFPPANQARFCWVVDPLDGTRNYAARFPVFATSIAVLDHGRPCVGVVCEHNLGQVYSAIQGQGTTLDGQPIRAQASLAGDDSLVGIPSSKDALTVSVVQSWAATKGLVCRNLGATAVHLAMVASGALSAAFAKRCKIWDIAAGWLLVKEAGGLITDISGGDHTPFRLDGDPATDIPFLAAAPTLHGRLLESVERCAAATRSGPSSRR
jgi:myo-inositol-1(or 4)-monophosphatase